MMAKYTEEELKQHLKTYFTKTLEQQHIDQGYKGAVGDLVWYDRVTGEPKYDIIGERLGISGDKVKVSFQAWRNAGNTPPGNIAGRAASNVSQNLQNPAAVQMQIPNQTNQQPQQVNSLGQVAQTLQGVAQLKQAEMSLNAMESQQGQYSAAVPTDPGAAYVMAMKEIVKELGGSQKSKTSDMALMMQMQEQSRNAQAADRARQDQMFMALLNATFQNQSSQQGLLIEALKGGGSRSSFEDRLMEHSFNTLMSPKSEPDDGLLRELVNSGQLPEIGKGLLDGVANVMSARRPPTGGRPSYLPAEQQAMIQTEAQAVPQVGGAVAPAPQLAIPEQPQITYEQKCKHLMGGIFDGLPQEYKESAEFIDMLKRQVEIAITRAEDRFPNNVNTQLVFAEKEITLVVNLRSICSNLNNVISGQVPLNTAVVVLQSLPVFEAFRGETYDSLLAMVSPYAAADPPGVKILAWDIEFLQTPAAANVISQILAAAFQGA